MRRSRLLTFLSGFLLVVSAVLVNLATNDLVLFVGTTWVWWMVGALVVVTMALDLATSRATGRARTLFSEEDLDKVLSALAHAVEREVTAELPRSLLPLSLRSGKTGLSTTDADLVDLYRHRTRKGLVILGEPGAGKSVLARQFVVRLLQERTDPEPVAVVFPLASWDTFTPLPKWLATELAIRYSMLGDVALRLVESGRVLPVLDGFDEVTPQRRDYAAHLVTSLDLPFVLTSRPEELLAVPFGPANFVHVESLHLQHVFEYLADTAGSELFDVLAIEPDSPLARLFTTPLMVDLVARAYAASETSVSELLDPVRFPTPEAIEQYLVGTVLPRSAHQSASHSVPGDAALHWLGFLAAHLTRLGVRGFAWWQLSRAAPRPLFPAVALLAGLLLGGLVFAGLGESWGAAGAGLGAGAVTAVALGVGGATATPFPTSIRLGTRRSRVSLLLGAFAGLAVATVVVLNDGTLPAALAWAAVGPGLGVLAALRFAATSGAEVEAVGGPHDSLMRDRTWAWVQGAITAIPVGLMGGLVDGPVFGVALGVTGGVAGFAFSAYYRYSVIRLWLAVRRRLPMNLMWFLAHEHRLGLLRRSGPVYSFYDERLLRHLAAESKERDTGAWLVLSLREDLVDRAFARADVRAVVEAPRLDTLKQEILAEVEDSVEEIVAATGAARDRFLAARAALLGSSGVPRMARFTGVYLFLAVICAAVAAGSLVAVSRSPVWPALQDVALLVLFGLLAAVTAGFTAQTVLVVWDRRRVNDEEPQRRVRGAVKCVASVARRSVAEVLLLLAVAMFVFDMCSRLDLGVPGLPLGAGIGAGFLALVWVWSRPRQVRWEALRSVRPELWPAERELPRRAVKARRDAVRAHAEFVDALVERGVLPQLAARVEVLAARSYELTLPEASVTKLGDLTESGQFVPTATSARLNRMLDTMSSGAIGLSGPRGIGKSTVLGMFGDRRYGGNPDDLTVVVPAPTNYDSRDFLAHLFGRMCLRVLPEDARLRTAIFRRRRIRLTATVLVGALLVVVPSLWPAVVQAGEWTWRNPRAGFVGVGVAVLAAVAVEGLARRRRPRVLSVEETARHHLRTLRYLETTTRTATGTVKPPAVGEVGGSWSRQRAEQVRTYPELVGDFREFLGFLASRLPSHPGRRPARIVICIDEVDKIATAATAEQFVNDIKTIFGVPGCFFLVAVSEDALASFSRRALTVRSTFDSAFDNVIRVSRLSLSQTRRLLVQRVLRLPEPFVWLCHALSGGLPRDLNRTVRQLYDIRADLGTDRLDRLTGELVRQDLETVAHGQIFQACHLAGPGTADLVRWLAETTSLPLDPAALLHHRDEVPQVEGTEPRLIAESFQAYLHYVAGLLRSFRDETSNLINILTGFQYDRMNPIIHLANARTHLSIDSAMADAEMDAYTAALVTIEPTNRRGPGSIS